MMINPSAWAKFVGALSKLNATATQKMAEFIEQTGWDFGDGTQALIDFAYGVSTKYGEAAAALACEMYDAIATASGASVELAIPAATATYGDVAKTVNGTAKSGNKDMMASAIGRLVKLAGADTTVHNAIRDGAEWAWIPHGDTCAFCITLASRGWQRASKKALKNGHAEHIHSNCDCMYSIRFDSGSGVDGYNPDKYKRIYYDASGGAPNDKINAIRRNNYAKNREKIRAQQNAAYATRKEKEAGE